MPIQMINSCVKAKQRHISISMGRVCYGPSMYWADIVMGRAVPEPSDCLILQNGGCNR